MTEQAPLLFGLPVASLIVPVAIVASAVAAIITALLSIRSQHRIASTRLTFETVQRTNWDEGYVSIRREFLKLCDGKRGLEAYAGASDTSDLGGDEEKVRQREDEYRQAQSIIQIMLNDRENLAIGVRRGMIDEQYLYRYMRGGIVRDWEKASALAAVIRRNPDKSLTYVEFEGLATAWQANLSYYRQDKPLPLRQRTVRIR